MKKVVLHLAFVLLVLSRGHAQVISPYIAGQNAWMPAAFGNKVYNGKLDQLWPMVKASGVKMIRIGGNGVEFSMPTQAQYIALIDSIRSIGAEPMVQVPVGRGLYNVQQAADMVDYVNNIMGRHVKYWIIGNEPNLDRPEGDIVDSAGVAAYIKSRSTAMKQKDPSILIVGPECAFYDSRYYPALVGGPLDITGKDPYGHYYVDVITFHSYAFNGTQTRAQVISSPNSFANNVNNLLNLIAAANTKNSRTGNAKLQWALTEMNVDYNNPADNTVQGVGVHSFLNGQYWLAIMNIAMQKGALTVQPWSIHEGGSRTVTDLGYIDGNGTTKPFKGRSSYHHLKLLSENVKGNYLSATDNDDLVTVFGSVFHDTTSVVILNQRSTQNFDFNLRLSTDPNTGTEPLKINLAANINAAYVDRIDAQSTMVLRFDKQGNLLKKIVYSVSHAANEIPPTYLTPPGMVVNRVFNGSNEGSGRLDAVELLVIRDHLDIRGWVVKDFDGNNTTDNGGKYRFNAIPFWQNLRSGTTIVLRKLEGGTGYVQDDNAADFTIDLLLENTAYVTDESSGNTFNITQTDMVVLKTGATSGVDDAIHAFATRGGGPNGVPSAIYNAVTAPKLVSPNTDAGGDPASMHYPLNPTMTNADYNGSAAAISKSTTRTWGYGFGPGNTSYIQSLRNLVSSSGVSVSARRAATGDDDVVAESGMAATLSAYPNPASGSYQVIFKVATDEPLLFLDLYDLRGLKVKPIYAGAASAAETYSFDVDASTMPKGIYLVRLSSNRGAKTFKVALK
jgi:hypothetical protein